MSLWLCLRFDQLPLQCQSLCEQQPVVVLAAQRVVRVGMAARPAVAAMGHHPGRCSRCSPIRS